MRKTVSHTNSLALEDVDDEDDDFARLALLCRKDQQKEVKLKEKRLADFHFRLGLAEENLAGREREGGGGSHVPTPFGARKSVSSSSKKKLLRHPKSGNKTAGRGFRASSPPPK